MFHYEYPVVVIGVLFTEELDSITIYWRKQHDVMPSSDDNNNILLSTPFSKILSYMLHTTVKW